MVRLMNLMTNIFTNAMCSTNTRKRINLQVKNKGKITKGIRKSQIGSFTVKHKNQQYKVLVTTNTIRLFRVGYMNHIVAFCSIQHHILSKLSKSEVIFILSNHVPFAIFTSIRKISLNSPRYVHQDTDLNQLSFPSNDGIPTDNCKKSS